jgi:hypothetical protein
VTEPRGVDALCVGAAKVAISLALLSTGFQAVSDDDYARLVIAQRFAEAPSLDPSGTSWLPVPFWIYGTAFALFGTGLGVARVTALGLGALSAVTVWAAARAVGSNRAGALVAGLVAALFPWSIWLGAAPLPEAPAAGLVVLSLVGLASDVARVRWISAGAVAVACFCRYEAWPVAVVVAGFALVDARRARSLPLVGAAVLALAPMVLWLLHGAVRHGDALFFVRRVAAYRAALGPGESLPVRALGPVWALVSQAPEVVVMAALACVRSGIPPWIKRPALGALAIVVFLALGELGGSGPTHHAARALLPVWFLGAVVAGDGAGRLLESGQPLAKVLYPAGLVAVALVLRAPFPDDFARRGDALAMGSRARELGAPALFVDTTDYAHLAVAAAFGRANLVTPFDDHDPRRARSADPFESAASLRARTQTMPNAWLVVSGAHRNVARELYTLRAESGDLALLEPTAPTAAR